MTTKLEIKRDKQMEQHAGVSIDACSAFLSGGEVRVLGELVATDGTPVNDYRELQVTVYDEDGTILGRNIDNWIEFGLRQSFEVEIDELPGSPAFVRVYPSKN